MELRAMTSTSLLTTAAPRGLASADGKLCLCYRHREEVTSKVALTLYMTRAHSVSKKLPAFGGVDVDVDNISEHVGLPLHQIHRYSNSD